MDQEMFFRGPSVHMLQEAPFHLPEFFLMEGPAFSFEGFLKLDQSIFVEEAFGYISYLRRDSSSMGRWNGFIELILRSFTRSMTVLGMSLN